MSTKISLVYCGMHGQGATVKEAKQDAARKIEAFLNEDFTPQIVQGRETTGVIWREPCGIYSSYIRDGKLGGVCSHESNSTMKDVAAGMRYAIAQLEADVESDEIPALIRADKSQVASYRWWLGFQRAYRRADGEDFAKHHWACEHANEFAPRDRDLEHQIAGEERAVALSLQAQ